VKTEDLDGKVIASPDCTKLCLSLTTKTGLDAYEITDNGNGELLLRKISDCEITIRPKSDNAIALV
jgi:hypothetical protein